MSNKYVYQGMISLSTYPNARPLYLCSASHPSRSLEVQKAPFTFLKTGTDRGKDRRQKWRHSPKTAYLQLDDNVELQRTYQLNLAVWEQPESLDCHR